MTDNLANLSRARMSIRLDDLSCDRRDRHPAQPVTRDHVVGVTTNPADLRQRRGHGRRYDDQFAGLAAAGSEVDEASCGTSPQSTTLRSDHQPGPDGCPSIGWPPDAEPKSIVAQSDSQT